MITKEKVIEYLKDRGGYDDTDTVLLDYLFELIGHVNELNVDIKKNGCTVTTHGPRSKNIKENPAIKLKLQCLDKIAIYCTKLGITVQERQKLKLLPEPEDELSEFD